MRTSASPMRFLTGAMRSSNDPPGSMSTISVARLWDRPAGSCEKWSVALMASVGRGWSSAVVQPSHVRDRSVMLAFAV